ncbi:hypothetical protein [Microviridae sp.]|nr:hypothetical protein [Microviridae sp.]
MREPWAQLRAHPARSKADTATHRDRIKSILRMRPLRSGSKQLTRTTVRNLVTLHKTSIKYARNARK